MKHEKNENEMKWLTSKIKISSCFGIDENNSFWHVYNRFYLTFCVKSITFMLCIHYERIDIVDNCWGWGLNVNTQRNVLQTHPEKIINLHIHFFNVQAGSIRSESFEGSLLNTERLYETWKHYVYNLLDLWLVSNYELTTNLHTCG